MSGFAMRRPLGKTGLQVSPLGIGCGNSIESEDLLYAFERGINYFFFSSDLHHFAYQRSREALKQLCKCGSAVRDQVVLATASYLNDPEKLHSIVLDQFYELHLEYVDVFHWGWVVDEAQVARLLQGSNALKDEEHSAFLRQVLQLDQLHEQAMEASKALVKQGLARHVGMSFHSRKAARRAIPDIDVMMIRYNISMTDVERSVFSGLSGDKSVDPGVVAFNVAHNGTYYFHKPPTGYPAGLYAPTIPDCYRFALSNPWVDVVLAGFTKRSEIDEALAMLDQGPLPAEEREFLCEYGSLFGLPTHAIAS